MYINKKNRSGKLSPKAVRCIWNGADSDHRHSVSAIPIQAQGSLWQLQKPVHSAKVVVVKGVFPLKQSVEVVSQARQQGRSARHPVNTVDRELAPSYLSRQSSALVQDWDYVAPGGGGVAAAAQQAAAARPASPPRPKATAGAAAASSSSGRV